jgi:hypothetical protein
MAVVADGARPLWRAPATLPILPLLFLFEEKDGTARTASEIEMYLF